LRRRTKHLISSRRSGAHLRLWIDIGHAGHLDEHFLHLLEARDGIGLFSRDRPRSGAHARGGAQRRPQVRNFVRQVENERGREQDKGVEKDEGLER
jgi:hypothetical protein